MYCYIVFITSVSSVAENGILLLLYNRKSAICVIIIVFRYIFYRILYDGAKSHYSGLHLQPPPCRIAARNESFNYNTHTHTRCERSVIEHCIIIPYRDNVQYTMRIRFGHVVDVKKILCVVKYSIDIINYYYVCSTDRMEKKI